MDKNPTLQLIYLTSPGRRLASPSAALLKPGGSPKPDASRLCISASPGPPCPLAWRWRTLMASSRRSSNLLGYREWKTLDTEKAEGDALLKHPVLLPVTYLNNVLLHLYNRKKNRGTLTHHGLNSTLKVRWRCSLAWGPGPLGCRAWRKRRTWGLFRYICPHLLYQ